MNLNFPQTNSRKRSNCSESGLRQTCRVSPRPHRQRTLPHTRIPSGSFGLSSQRLRYKIRMHFPDRCHRFLSQTNTEQLRRVWSPGKTIHRSGKPRNRNRPFRNCTYATHQGHGECSHYRPRMTIAFSIHGFPASASPRGKFRDAGIQSLRIFREPGNGRLPLQNRTNKASCLRRMRPFSQ